MYHGKATLAQAFRSVQLKAVHIYAVVGYYLCGYMACNNMFGGERNSGTENIEKGACLMS